MAFGLFRDREAEQFGEELAVELARRFPPRALAGERAQETKRDAAIAKAMDHISLAAGAFRNRHKVGVLKQVGMSRKFQQKLDTLGYEDEFIKAATLRLAQSMAAKR